jgi:hypothetical protein
MALSREATLLLMLLLGPLLAFLIWGFWRSRQVEETAHHLLGLRDDVLMAFAVLAVFAIIAFIVFVLLI